MESEILIEVCCGGVDDAVAACAGGAGRVELNSGMFLGGLTPSIGTIAQCKEQVDVPVMVMVRPRAGGFCYSDAEMRSMVRDVALAVEHGADGVVFGVLGSGGGIDMERCGELIGAADGAEAVFHRAFDVLPDAVEGLEQLIELGFKRVLTSGQKPNAIDGADLLAKLIAQAAGRIEILPGGGIRKHNVQWLIKHTGAKQIHMSAFKPVSDGSMIHVGDIKFGGKTNPAEDRYHLIDSCKVAEVAKLLGE